MQAQGAFLISGAALADETSVPERIQKQYGCIASHDQNETGTSSDAANETLRKT